MTVVLVHGVPETAAIWSGVRDHLERDSVTLALPGFGCPRPAGFGATMDEYVAWLHGELDRIGGPVDLVGHDWGGILTTRIATSAGAERLHSWASDVVNTVDADYVWHDLAQIWITPGEGEKFWDGFRADPAGSAGLLAALGVPDDRASEMVAAIDETMIGCILDLYRSSADIGRDWAMTGPSSVPGLAMVGGADTLADPGRVEAMADRLGAAFAELDGQGHFWPLQGAAVGAAALEAFWDGLPG